MRRFNEGDKVYCREEGISGIVMKFYTPTSCAEQTKIKCADGIMFHAPTSCFEPYKHGTSADMVVMDESTNVSDQLVISYDQAGEDRAVLTICRTNQYSKFVVNALVGKEATDVYNKLINKESSLGGESAKDLYARMMNDHNNNTMVMPKGNGRSMMVRNMAEMFDAKKVELPRGNGKSRQDMEAFIDEISDNLYRNLKERKEHNENR